MIILLKQKTYKHWRNCGNHKADAYTGFADESTGPLLDRTLVYRDNVNSLAMLVQPGQSVLLKDIRRSAGSNSRSFVYKACDLTIALLLPSGNNMLTYFSMRSYMLFIFHNI